MILLNFQIKKEMSVMHLFVMSTKWDESYTIMGGDEHLEFGSLLLVFEKTQTWIVFLEIENVMALFQLV